MKRTKNKRIIIETFDDDTKKYRAQTNKLFNIIPWIWHSCFFWDAERDMYFEAVFDKEEDAFAYLGYPNKKVIRRDVIYFA